MSEEVIRPIPQWFKLAENHMLPQEPHMTTQETMRALEDQLGSDAASDTLALNIRDENIKARKRRKIIRAQTGSHGQ